MPQVKVYILKSITTGLLYVGISRNLSRRLREHKKGQSIGTRGKGPWELVHQETFSDYKTAREREKFLKSGKGREWSRSAFG